MGGEHESFPWFLAIFGFFSESRASPKLLPFSLGCRHTGHTDLLPGLVTYDCLCSKMTCTCFFTEQKSQSGLAHSYTGNVRVPFLQLHGIPAQDRVTVAAGTLCWRVKGVSSLFLSQKSPGIYAVFVQVSGGQTPWPRNHEEAAMCNFSPSYQSSLLPSRAKRLRIHGLSLYYPASFRRGIEVMEDLGQPHFLPQSKSTSLNLSLEG